MNFPGSSNPSLAEKRAEADAVSPADRIVEERARELARSHEVVPGSRGVWGLLARRPALYVRLDEREALLEKVHGFYAARAANPQEPIASYAEEWLLDNYYLVRQAIALIRSDLPRGYYRRLPQLAAGPLAGFPRAYAVAVEILRCSAVLLDLDLARRFVNSYQEVAPLTVGELWALAILLRAGSLEFLADAVSRCARLDAGGGDPGGRSAPPLFEMPPGLADEDAVVNCITTLRTLSTLSWKTFFEDASRVEGILRRDPAGIYPRMDFETRDRYRKAVEELALLSRVSELDVAGKAVQLAREAGERGDSRSSRETHVGFYLVGAGRRAIESALGLRPPWILRLGRWMGKRAAAFYLGSIAALAIAALGAFMGCAFAFGGAPWQIAAAGVLGLIPSVTIAVNIINRLAVTIVPPGMIPKLDFEREGVPEEFRTMVVVPSLFSSKEDIESLLEQIELHYLRNPDPNVRFALLTDFSDAPREVMPGDEELLEAARSGLLDLNRKYGGDARGPFYLFHRRRLWNDAEGCWMGWERKRGKLHEFNHLILGKGETTHNARVGDLDFLKGVKFVITLDEDTVLLPGDAPRLIGALAHPLNRAEFDPSTGAVAAGYTVLQPRTKIRPSSVLQSLFTRIYAGDTGLDIYTLAVSDVYQDLFGEGIYVGKGIYDVAAFERSLEGRVPENALLSHDLFEGVHGRAGLVSDVVLFEDFPPHYLVHTKRTHRWVRGDWQLLPWLLPRISGLGPPRKRNGLSTIDRWKILENLRRSLLMPALLMLFLGGWLWLPGPAWFWTAAGLLVLAIHMIANGIVWLIQLARGRLARIALRNDALRFIPAVVFLPYEALLNLGAIGITLVRVFITRRQLLKWTTFASAARLLGEGVEARHVWGRMGASVLMTAAAAALVAVLRPEALAAAAPLLAVWLLSPHFAFWISRPPAPEPPPPPPDQILKLRSLARRTWFFFEQHVGPEDSWLPPDHFQESPRGLAAHRTSPTNIGLMLLSAVAAYDLGYIEALDLTLRIQNALDSMDRLEREQGHFLNWYDTRTLKPLSPRYVSSVDSGNLVACLITLKQALLSIPEKSIPRSMRRQGLADTLAVLGEVVGGIGEMDPRVPVAAVCEHVASLQKKVAAAPEDPRAWRAALSAIARDEWKRLESLLAAMITPNAAVIDSRELHSLRLWAERVQYLILDSTRELDMLSPWLSALSRKPALFTEPGLDPEIGAVWQKLVEQFPDAPRLRDIVSACEQAGSLLEELRERLASGAGPADRLAEARKWCSGLRRGLEAARATARVLLEDVGRLAERIEALVQEVDFSFLYSPNRRVLHIGYNVDTGKLDPHFYDLLASEARIASIVAIAKGDVPQSHWWHLGRPLTRAGGRQALLSWSATLFEYLMPPLLMKSVPGTMLHHSCLAAVDHQVRYGRRKGVPWGISESGYYRFDAQQNYQYKAFGVPGLGFKRDLDEDIVVAPYASMLALPFRSRPVLENLERFARLGLIGPCGLYEAIDYNSDRLPPGMKHAVVRSYMSHHQGMILLSLVNGIQDRVMVERFHWDPRIESIELLLQERVPQRVRVEFPHRDKTIAPYRREPRVRSDSWPAPVQSPGPQAHVLSNDNLTVVITSAGTGFSRWREFDLTRWRADTTLDDCGAWIYVVDLESGDLWSGGFQPAAVPSAQMEVSLSPHQADFRRRDRDISLLMEITVPPSDDVEIRRITLTSHSDRPRRLLLVSYGEVALAQHAADQRHPAFNKLFIESEHVPALNGVLFRRRPRSAREEIPYLAHVAVSRDGRKAAFETDRARFLGRGGTARSPQVLREGRKLSGSAGATLDPIFSLAQEVRLDPRGNAQVVFLTAAAGSRRGALAVAEKYRSLYAVDRAFDRARAQSEREMHHLNLDAASMARFQQLLSLLLYPRAFLRPESRLLAANSRGQSGLWGFGISGDHPILLARVNGEEGLPLLRELLLAHTVWRSRRLKVDLVVINQKETGYDQELQGQIHRLIAHTRSDAWLNQRGGIFVLREDQMAGPDRILLETAARAVLEGAEGPLAAQLAGQLETPPRLPAFVPALSGREDPEPTPPLERPAGRLFDNGLGGFSRDGREYRIYLDGDRLPPAPWANVIANPDFGFLATESGGGFTWAANSGENRLTPWSNDPVADPPGEALYLRDEETGRVWSSTPLPVREPEPYLVRHGAGYTVFEHCSHGLKQELRLFAAHDAPVKISRLRLENAWNRVRRITVTYFVPWTLGVLREDSQPFIIPEYDAERRALLARNPYNVEFAERIAFAAAGERIHGLTTDRTEFIGRMGTPARPAALQRIGLSNAVAAGGDPCAALQVHIDLQPGESREIHFLLGQGSGREETLGLIQKYLDPAQVEAAWESMLAFWDELLGAVEVKTPDPAMDLMLNRWLLYQDLSCRIWGRSGFYQSSGAFGFRDQLQDAMALIHARPQIAREQILRAARHQFEEGDVLHWWHPPSGRGVRTRISDDLLWLPFASAHYVAATGDASLLREEVPFLCGEQLGAEEHERYGQYSQAPGEASIYEHCRRALRRGSTESPRGLPLIGGGDWNDGMNRVGFQGKGESIWLGWFLYSALDRFVPLCEAMGDDALKAEIRGRARELRRALEAHGWDGKWYLRATYDDGAPLGSSANRECRIDSISQSWAVLSGGADPARAALAMEAVHEQLLLPREGLLLLSTPPFDKTPRDPGYIKGYPPGVRENGGQYTHAALWAVWAFARLGQGDRAEELFRMLNPVHRAETAEKVRIYRLEPYAVAADIYSVPPHAGRGGWSWYTGSAGWMYRLGLEAILGLRRRGGALVIDPCIPRDWREFEIIYRHAGSVYRIRVENPEGVHRGVEQVTLDGSPIAGNRIPLSEEGRRREVRVILG